MYKQRKCCQQATSALNRAEHNRYDENKMLKNLRAKDFAGYYIPYIPINKSVDINLNNVLENIKYRHWQEQFKI